MKQDHDKSVEHVIRPADIEAIIEVNRQFTFRRASESELIAGVKLAESLMGTGIADVEVIKRVHSQTTVTAWVTGDPVEGIHLMVPLTRAGEQAVRASNFHPENPDPAHCARPGDDCAGVYVGVYAGSTKDARRNIMHGAAVIRVQCFGTVPCFAKAATEDGARSMKSLGFAPVADVDGALWIQEALTTSVEKAA